MGLQGSGPGKRPSEGQDWPEQPFIEYTVAAGEVSNFVFVVVSDIVEVSGYGVVVVFSNGVVVVS